MTFYERRRARVIGIATSWMMLWSASAGAQEDAEVSDAEMRELEAAMAADAEADASPAPTAATSSSGAGTSPLLQLDVGFSLNVAGSVFSDEPAQVGAHDPDHTGFTFQQLEMSVGAAIDPSFRLDAAVIFGLFGVEIEEAFATAMELPLNLQLRAGQMLLPFGRFNTKHPHSWVMQESTLPNGKFFGPEASRGVGGELSWLTPLPWFFELTAAVTEASGKGYLAAPLRITSPAELLYTARAEQFFPLGDAFSALWGVSGQFGPNDSGPDNRTEMFGTDLYLRFRPVASANRTALGLQLEGMMRRRQVPGDLLVDYGAYGLVFWDIDPQWQVATRWDWATGLENDPLDEEWDADRHRVSIQGALRPSHFSRVRLQLGQDSMGWRDRPLYFAHLGIEVSAGAHAAHQF